MTLHIIFSALDIYVSTIDHSSIVSVTLNSINSACGGICRSHKVLFHNGLTSKARWVILINNPMIKKLKRKKEEGVWLCRNLLVLFSLKGDPSFTMWVTPLWAHTTLVLVLHGLPFTLRPNKIIPHNVVFLGFIAWRKEWEISIATNHATYRSD